jgi:hypothetical protein
MDMHVPKGGKHKSFAKIPYRQRCFGKVMPRADLGEHAVLYFHMKNRGFRARHHIILISIACLQPNVQEPAGSALSLFCHP